MFNIMICNITKIRIRLSICTSSEVVLSSICSLIVFNIIYKMDSNIGFEMSLIVVEAIRGRCASFMSLPATV